MIRNVINLEAEIKPKIRYLYNTYELAVSPTAVAGFFLLARLSCNFRWISRLNSESPLRPTSTPHLPIYNVNIA